LVTSVVHLAVAPEVDDPRPAARLGAALPGADALVRWEPGVFVSLLPASPNKRPRSPSRRRNVGTWLRAGGSRLANRD
jgi:hypothetical protein